MRIWSCVLEQAGAADNVEVCACAGVSAGEIRACGSLARARETTRATTGCGGCAGAVRALLAAAPSDRQPQTSGTTRGRTLR